MPKRGSTSDSARRGDTLAALRTAFDILVRVQNDAGCTVGGLAKAFRLGPKQIGRYLTVLEEFGVGFEQDGRGRRRSPLKLSTARRNPPFNALFLTREELLLLFAHLAGVHHAGDAATRARLRDKVRLNLGVAPLHGRQLESILGPFEKAYKSYDGKRAIIADLLVALYDNQTCRVTYQTPDGEGPRTYPIEPYELVEFDGGLYVYCRVPRHVEVRLLAVERIQELTRNAEQFLRRGEVVQTIAEKKRRAFRILDDEQELHVVLRFSPRVAFYIAERIWHPTQTISRHEDGSLTLEFTASGRVEIERWIKGWGEDATILQSETAKYQTHGR